MEPVQDKRSTFHLVDFVGLFDWATPRGLRRRRADRAVPRRLDSLVRRRGDEWSCLHDSLSGTGHGLYQYPATMVPRMQGELLAELVPHIPRRVALDPFVGSGTSMVQSMLLGLDFYGRDINPMAILLCRVKRGPFNLAAFERGTNGVLERARADGSCVLETRFPGWSKWFRRDVAIALSRMRRAIAAEPTLQTRRFLWVALAETVRRTSNARISTVKLHSYAAADIQSRSVDALAVFEHVLARNLDRLKEQRDALEAAGQLHRGRYRGLVEIEFANARVSKGERSHAGLLVTSPPYGDNRSTVAYGQHSWLPLQWIQLSDIDRGLAPSLVENAYTVDRLSLGGSLKRDSGEAPALVSSPSLAETVDALDDLPPDRARRVRAFFGDLEETLPKVLSELAPAALMAWTVGNRSVGGRPVPMDAILTELLRARGARLLARIERRIPNGKRRMATRNDLATTMSRETVLIFRGRTAG